MKMQKIHTVTVKNITKEDRNVLTIDRKEIVKKGENFETTPENAKQLQSMYPQLFKIVSENVENKINHDEKELKEIAHEKKIKFMHSMYRYVEAVLLPATSLMIEDDDEFQSILEMYNVMFEEVLDEEHPRFYLMKKIIYTAENCPPDAKIGDEGGIYTFERKKVLHFYPKEDENEGGDASDGKDQNPGDDGTPKTPDPTENKKGDNKKGGKK